MRDLTALRELTVPKITEELDELSVDELRALKAIEEQEEAPRVSLLRLLDEKLGDAEPAPAAVVDETPGWQKLDWNGPITGDQAEWRNRHLKPGIAPVTK